MFNLYYSGDPLPHIEYTKQEVETWGTVFRELTKLYPTHACSEYNHLFPLFVENCGYREDCIPQFEDISNFLKGKNNNNNDNYCRFHNYDVCNREFRKLKYYDSIIIT